MRSTVSQLLIRLRAYRRRVRREEAHLLGLRNEVRSFMGGEPLDPYSQPTQQDTGKSEQARKAALREADFSDTEPAGPAELSFTD